MQRRRCRPQGARRTARRSCALADGADVVHRELPARRRRPARHRLRRRQAPATPASSTARPPATARTGPAPQWAGHDLNYLGGRRLPRLLGPRRRRRPADPRRHRRRQRRRRHARGDGDPRRPRAAGRAPARARTSTCRWPTACSRSWRCTSTSTSPPAPCPAPATACSPAATPATTPTAPATAGGSRSPPSSRGSGPTSAAPLGLDGGSSTRPTTRCRTRSAPTSRAAFATRARDEWVAELAPADTCVAPVLVRARGRRRRAVRGPRRVRRGRRTPSTATFRQVALPVPRRGHVPTRRTDTDDCSTPRSPRSPLREERA